MATATTASKTAETDKPHINEAQMRQLHALLRDHGITGDKAVHDYLTVKLGRKVESRTTLTQLEAATLIDHLASEGRHHVGLAEALVAFQREMPAVSKGNTARVPTKDGGSYSYTYADLTDVSAAAIPLLNKHGMTFTSRPRLTASGGYELVGVLRHVSGEHDEGALPLFGRDAQQIGGSITYARRYLLGCMTGIVTDDDDDNAWTRTADRAQAGDPGPWAPPSPGQSVARLAELAKAQNTDLAGITTKLRETHGGIEVAQLATVPAEALAEHVQRVEAYIAQQGTNAGGGS